MKRYLVIAILVSLLLSLAAIPVMAQGVQNVQLHGYMQNRFYAPQAANMRIVTERLSLSATGTIDEDITAYAEVYYHPWAATPTYVESAYMDMPLALGRIRIGKGRQLNFGITPNYANRKTTEYGLVPETFTADRIIGVQYSQKTGMFDGGVSLYTDTSLGTRGIGFFPGATAADVVNHFADRDISANMSGELAGSIRLGISRPCFQAHVSGALGSLNQTDLTSVYTAYGLAAGTDNTHNKYGADATYAVGPFVAQGEYYVGNYSIMKITGYNVLLGYTTPSKQRITVRYNTLNNNRTPLADQRTWDTQQWIVGLVQPIAKGVWAELEYVKNTANPGAGGVVPKNDLIYLELFTGF